ncbi:MAG: ATP synthase F1 subunit gamma [Verrucomicrobiales bacterium]|nr:ATP synthase F1 subunit gamma [Verrucomicrobiales bacterium]
MANLRDIRRRISSVKNTAQITKAMQLVAASKMKKAQDQATSGRPYADLMNKVLVNLKEQCDEDSHPLLQEGKGDKELVLLITTDKGLCAGLNSNLIRLTSKQADTNASYVTLGSKGRKAMARVGKDLIADFTIGDPVPFIESRRISQFIIDQFLSGELKSVKVGFTNFINTMTQEAMFETLLPVRAIDLGRDKDFVGMGGDSDPVEVSAGNLGNYGGYIFEPSASHVLDRIVPQYVDYQVYQMILESRASEHSARMVAMKGATDNANQMVKDLTLEYNKARQAAITAELLEITTAMKALE